MYIRVVYGIDVFGRVDRVKGNGGFSVGTRFFHIWWVPVIPLGSYVIVDEWEEGFQGVHIPLNLKSLLFAWGRGALGVAGVFSLLLMLVTSNVEQRVFFPVVACAAAGLIALSYLFTRASPHRARELAERLAAAAGLLESASTGRGARRRTTPVGPLRRDKPMPAATPYRAAEAPRTWRPPPPPSATQPRAVPSLAAAPATPDPSADAPTDGPRFLR
jgi:hypothetical protein